MESDYHAGVLSNMARMRMGIQRSSVVYVFVLVLDSMYRILSTLGECNLSTQW